MSTFKLTYFNAKGTAEVSRFIFAYTGLEYEDRRVDDEEWRQLESSTPFGVLPVLEENGRKLGGSMIIARHLGEKNGLAGRDEFENAEIASIADAVNDLNQEIGKIWFEEDEERRAEMARALKEEIAPRKLRRFEKLSATSEHGWLYGNRLSWADFFLYQTLGWVLQEVDEEALTGFTSLTKLRASVEALPQIADWIKNRPNTEH